MVQGSIGVQKELALSCEAIPFLSFTKCVTQLCIKHVFLVGLKTLLSYSCDDLKNLYVQLLSPVCLYCRIQTCHLEAPSH